MTIESFFKCRNGLAYKKVNKFTPKRLVWLGPCFVFNTFLKLFITNKLPNGRRSIVLCHFS